MHCTNFHFIAAKSGGGGDKSRFEKPGNKGTVPKSKPGYKRDRGKGGDRGVQKQVKYRDTLAQEEKAYSAAGKGRRVNYNSASETSESESNASNTSTRGDYLKPAFKKGRAHGLKDVKRDRGSDKTRYALGHIYWMVQAEPASEPVFAVRVRSVIMKSG
jgi:hypothetical protein